MKRKNSIALLLCLSLFISCSKDSNSTPAPPIENDYTLEAGMTLGGKITVGGVPRKDIVVTDGYTVVKTDEKGIYQMVRNGKAKFVSVTIPADCKLPVKNGVYKAAFPIAQNKPIFYADFPLESTGKETKFILLGIGDPQVSNTTELNRFKFETVPDMNNMAQSSLSVPTYGFMLGDMVWDKMNLFSSFINVASGITFPYFQAIGNHDHDMNTVNNDYNSSAIYETYYGPRYYSIDRGDCHIIILDDVDYAGGSNKTYSSHITQEQLDWLKKDLEFVPKEKLLILGMHIPTKRRASSSAVSNNQALYDLLAGYKVKILSAHTHYNQRVTINNNIEEYIHGAACGSFWSDVINGDGAPNGYMVYEINGANVTNSYYKATGKVNSYQIKMYPTGNTTSKPTSVIANIWGWHSNWTVTVYENNVNKGEMNRFESYDPDAKRIFNGNSGLAHPTASQPVKTDHLFYYTPTGNNSVIRVEAKDEFGNVYTNEINSSEN